jgi:3-methyladenine DNA glycosylase AlkD
MHSYLVPLKKQLLLNASTERAAGAKAYLLNQFEFYGIATPQRRRFCLDYIKTNRLSSLREVEKIVKEAWRLPEREWQYFGIELLMQYKKQWKLSTIKLIEYCITHKCWWDTVDYMADAWAGEYFKLFPDQIIHVTGNGIAPIICGCSAAALLFQKKYKRLTNTKLLSKYILHLSGSKEFFIRKAIGWIMREYAKTDPSWVKKFVQSNNLSPLSRREALKKFNR